MKVFIDTSVIVASLLSPTGGSSKIFSYIKLKKIFGITSQTALDELLVEEKYIKLHKSKKEIEQFISKSNLLIRKRISQKEIIPYQGLVEVTDAHVIAGAILTKSHYLVSLDKKHLLRKDIQASFPQIKILSPKELLEMIVE